MWWSKDDAAADPGGASPGFESQAVTEMKEQFEQQQVLVQQLKELVRQNEQQLKNKEHELEDSAAKLSKIKLQHKARMSRLENQLQESLKKHSETPTKEEDNSHGTPTGDSSRGKVLMLKRKLEENRTIFQKKEKELEDNKRGVEQVLQDVQAQLQERDDIIEQLRTRNENGTEPTNGELAPGEPGTPKKDNTVQAMYAQMVYKDSRMLELDSRIMELERQVMDLQETISEKDEVIRARNTAIQLMTDDLSRRGKVVVDQLDDTRDEMRLMQQNFAMIEGSWRQEKEILEKKSILLKADFSENERRLSEVTESCAKLESVRFDLSSRNAQLQEKVVGLQELLEKSRSQAAPVTDVDVKGLIDENERLTALITSHESTIAQLKSSLEEAIKSGDQKLIKLKAQQKTVLKKLEKQIQDLKSGARREEVEILKQTIEEYEKRKERHQAEIVDWRSKCDRQCQDLQNDMRMIAILEKNKLDVLEQLTLNDEKFANMQRTHDLLRQEFDVVLKRHRSANMETEQLQQSHNAAVASLEESQGRNSERDSEIIDYLRLELESARTTINDLENLRDKLEASLQARETDISDATETVALLEAAAELRSGEISDLSERLNLAVAQVGRETDERMQSLSQRLSEKHSQFEEAIQERNELERRLTSLIDTTTEERQEIESLCRDLAESNSRCSDVQERLDHLTVSCQSQEALIQEYVDSLSSNDADLSATVERLSIVSAELKAALLRVEQSEEAARTERHRADELDDQLASVTRELARNAEALNVAQHKMTDAENEAAHARILLSTTETKLGQQRQSYDEKLTECEQHVGRLEELESDCLRHSEACRVLESRLETEAVSRIASEEEVVTLRDAAAASSAREKQTTADLEQRVSELVLKRDEAIRHGEELTTELSDKLERCLRSVNQELEESRAAYGAVATDAEELRRQLRSAGDQRVALEAEIDSLVAVRQVLESKTKILEDGGRSLDADLQSLFNRNRCLEENNEVLEASSLLMKEDVEMAIAEKTTLGDKISSLESVNGSLEMEKKSMLAAIELVEEERQAWEVERGAFISKLNVLEDEIGRLKDEKYSLEGEIRETKEALEGIREEKGAWEEQCGLFEEERKSFDLERESLLNNYQSLEESHKLLENDRLLLDAENEAAREAVKFLSAEKELMEEKYAVLGKEISLFDFERESFLSESQSLKEAYRLLENAKDSLDVENIAIKEENVLLDKAKTSVESEMDALSIRSQSVEEENRLLLNTKDSIDAEKTEIKEAYELLRTERESMHAKCSLLEQEKDSLEVEKESLLSRSHALEDEIRALKLTKELIDAENTEIKEAYELLKTEIESMHAKCSLLEQEKGPLAVEKELLLSRSRALEDEIRTLELTKETLETTSASLNLEFERRRNEIILLQERVSGFQKDKDDLQLQLESTVNRIQQLEDDNESLAGSNASLEHKVGVLENQIDALQTERESQRLERRDLEVRIGELETTKQALEMLDAEVGDARGQLLAVHREKHDLEAACRLLGDEKELLEASKRDDESRIRDLESSLTELGDLQGQLEVTSQLKWEMEIAIEKKLAELEDTKSEVKRLDSELDLVRNQLETVKSSHRESVEKVEKLEEEVRRSSDRSDDLRAQLELLQEQADDFGRQLQQSSADKSELESEAKRHYEVVARLQLFEAEFQNATQVSVELQSRIDQLNEELRGSREQNNRTMQYTEQLEGDLQATSEAMQAVEVERDAAKNELDTVKAELDSTKVELISSKAEFDATKVQFETGRNEYNNLENEYEVLKVELDSTKVEVISVKADFDAAKIEFETGRYEYSNLANEEYKSLKDECDALNDEYKSLKDEYDSLKVTHCDIEKKLTEVEADLSSTLLREQEAHSRVQRLEVATRDQSELVVTLAALQEDRKGLQLQLKESLDQLSAVSESLNVMQLQHQTSLEENRTLGLRINQMELNGVDVEERSERIVQLESRVGDLEAELGSAVRRLRESAEEKSLVAEQQQELYDRLVEMEEGLRERGATEQRLAEEILRLTESEKRAQDDIRTAELRLEVLKEEATWRDDELRQEAEHLRATVARLETESDEWRKQLDDAEERQVTLQSDGSERELAMAAELLDARAEQAEAGIRLAEFQKEVTWLHERCASLEQSAETSRRETEEAEARHSEEISEIKALIVRPRFSNEGSVGYDNESEKGCIDSAESEGSPKPSEEDSLSSDLDSPLKKIIADRDIMVSSLRAEINRLGGDASFFEYNSEIGAVKRSVLDSVVDGALYENGGEATELQMELQGANERLTTLAARLLEFEGIYERLHEAEQQNLLLTEKSKELLRVVDGIEPSPSSASGPDREEEDLVGRVRWLVEERDSCQKQLQIIRQEIDVIRDENERLKNTVSQRNDGGSTQSDEAAVENVVKVVDGGVTNSAIVDEKKQGAAPVPSDADSGQSPERQQLRSQLAISRMKAEKMLAKLKQFKDKNDKLQLQIGDLTQHRANVEDDNAKLRDANDRAHGEVLRLGSELRHAERYWKSEVKMLADRLDTVEVANAKLVEIKDHLESRLDEQIDKCRRLATDCAEASLVKTELDSIKAELGATSSELDEAKARMEEQSARCQQLTASNADLELRVSSAEAGGREASDQLSLTVRQLEGQLESAVAHTQFIESDNREYQELIRRLEDDRRQREAEVRQQSERVVALSQELGKLKEKAAVPAPEPIELAELRRSCEDAVKRCKDSENSCRALESEVDYLRVQLEEAHEERNLLERERDDLLERLADAQLNSVVVDSKAPCSRMWNEVEDTGGVERIEAAVVGSESSFTKEISDANDDIGSVEIDCMECQTLCKQVEALTERNADLATRLSAAESSAWTLEDEKQQAVDDARGREAVARQRSRAETEALLSANAELAERSDGLAEELTELRLRHEQLELEYRLTFQRQRETAEGLEALLEERRSGDEGLAAELEQLRQQLIENGEALTKRTAMLEVQAERAARLSSQLATAQEAATAADTDRLLLSEEVGRLRGENASLQMQLANWKQHLDGFRRNSDEEEGAGVARWSDVEADGRKSSSPTTGERLLRLEAELNETMQGLHRRDLRCEELTSEISRMVEERDSLQIRLSRVMRADQQKDIDIQLLRQDLIQREQNAMSDTSLVQNNSNPLVVVATVDSSDITKRLEKCEAQRRELQRLNAVLDDALATEREHCSQLMADLKLSNEERIVLSKGPKRMDSRMESINISINEETPLVPEHSQTLVRSYTSTPWRITNWLQGRSLKRVLHV